MTHGDDDGVVLPPRIAPTQIVILPVTPKEETRAKVLEACDKLATRLRETRYADFPIEVAVDRRELGGGVKNWEWIKKGVPLRVEIGPRDLEKNSVEVSRRDQAGEGKGVNAAWKNSSRAPRKFSAQSRTLYMRVRRSFATQTRV